MIKLFGTRHDRDTVFAHQIASDVFVAHFADNVRLWTDKDNARVLDLSCKVKILAQKAVSRMYRISATLFSDFDDLFGVQIAF